MASRRRRCPAQDTATRSQVVRKSTSARCHIRKYSVSGGYTDIKIISTPQGCNKLRVLRTDAPVLIALL